MREYHAAYYEIEDGWYMAVVMDFPGVVSQGRTLRSAGQSHLSSKRGGKTDRGLHTALGNMACRPFGGEQGMGDVS